jgi:hypothetical protein
MCGLTQDVVYASPSSTHGKPEHRAYRTCDTLVGPGRSQTCGDEALTKRGLALWGWNVYASR